jgi:hypothetical protein
LLRRTSDDATSDGFLGFQLDPGRSERLVFVARSGQEKRLRWRLILEAVVDDDRVDIVIDDDGKPFELVAGRNPLNDEWIRAGDAWVPER